MDLKLNYDVSYETDKIGPTTNPLTDIEDEMLAKHGVLYDVAMTMRDGAKELTERYNEDYFDMVLSVNALDHARGLVQCVRQMATVAKPGGLIFVVATRTRRCTPTRTSAASARNLANVDGRLVARSCAYCAGKPLRGGMHAVCAG